MRNYVRRGWSCLAAGLLAGVCLVGRGAGAAEPADAWLTNAVPPAGIVVGAAPEGMFESLKASVQSGRMGVEWMPADGGWTNGAATLLASVGVPGHWPSRDWRPWPMVPRAGRWEVGVPLVSVDEPVLYLVRVVREGQELHSGVRVFRPSAAGMALPTFPFTGFLDGFEEGMTGWESTVAGGQDGGGAVRVSTNALTGRMALRLEVPAGRGSMTVGTTRIQGWMLLEREVMAVRFAARTGGGTGKVGCALHGNARTPDLSVYPAAGTFDVGPAWQRLEVPLEAFRGLRPGTVDSFTLQFFADPGRELFVDDVELVLR